MFLAGIIKQIWFLLFHSWYPPKWVLRQLLGFTPREIHTSYERQRMKDNKFSLWFEILYRDDWRCGRCKVRNFENKEWGKPKMEVDHIVPIYHWGTSVRSNLQVLCHSCNKAKGARLRW